MRHLLLGGQHPVHSAISVSRQSEHVWAAAVGGRAWRLLLPGRQGDILRFAGLRVLQEDEGVSRCATIIVLLFMAICLLGCAFNAGYKFGRFDAMRLWDAEKKATDSLRNLPAGE